MNKKSITGGCLCGSVNYKFKKTDVISAHHCHCTDCQKSTGSGKATIVLIPDKLLTIEGDLKFFTVVGKDGGHVNRGFCPNCGSPLISFVEEKKEIKFVKAGSLDDSSWIKIISNFWSSSSRNWSPVNERITSFSHNPEYPAS